MKKTARKIVEAPTNDAAPEGSNTDHTYHMTLAEIKELIELVSEKQFNEFELECGRFRLRMQKGASRSALELNRQALSSQPTVAESSSVESPLTYTSNALAQPAPAPATPAPEEKLHLVTSPIVGTFYRASSPTAEPFVKLGDPVERGVTLCIIEAMKLMNEIESDASGEIAKIFVENGQPVEFGQPLFGLKV